MASLQSKYALKTLQTDAATLTAAGGVISTTDSQVTVTLPEYRYTATPDTDNAYRVAVTAEDVKGNRSNREESTVVVQAPQLSAEDSEVTSDKTTLKPDGVDKAVLTFRAQDAEGNAVSGLAVNASFTVPDGMAILLSDTFTETETKGTYTAELKGSTPGEVSVMPLVDGKDAAKASVPEVALGDLHGNALLMLHQSITTGHLKVKDEGAFTKLQQAYHSGDSATFNKLLPDAVKAGAAQGRMIMVGDVLADRGLSDFCSLNVLAQMDKLGVKYDVLLGNHDLAAFGQCQSLVPAYTPDANPTPAAPSPAITWASESMRGPAVASLPRFDSPDYAASVSKDGFKSVGEAKEAYTKLMNKAYIPHLHLLQPASVGAFCYSHAPLTGDACKTLVPLMEKELESQRRPVPQKSDEMTSTNLAHMDKLFLNLMFKDDGVTMINDNWNKLFAAAVDGVKYSSIKGLPKPKEDVWLFLGQMVYRQANLADIGLTKEVKNENGEMVKEVLDTPDGMISVHGHTSAIGKESYVTLDGMGGKIGSDLIFDRNVHVATTLSGQNNSFHP
ncbi:invasin domain 3-containing protein [Escherichia fergusonii]|uniref:invasin domain 3-containing protein n=1 Tax=Escherichia fergusonii TaxID=564 RepID=UPI00210B2D8F|nr:invasin domain 3-containing protein [Escherichia fergusonii]